MFHTLGYVEARLKIDEIDGMDEGFTFPGYA